MKEKTIKSQCKKGYRYCDACEALKLDDGGTWTCSEGKKAHLHAGEKKDGVNNWCETAAREIAAKNRG